MPLSYVKLFPKTLYDIPVLLKCNLQSSYALASVDNTNSGTNTRAIICLNVFLTVSYLERV